MQAGLRRSCPERDICWPHSVTLTQTQLWPISKSSWPSWKIQKHVWILWFGSLAVLHSGLMQSRRRIVRKAIMVVTGQLAQKLILPWQQLGRWLCQVWTKRSGKSARNTSPCCLDRGFSQRPERGSCWAQMLMIFFPQFSSELRPLPWAPIYLLPNNWCGKNPEFATLAAKHVTFARALPAAQAWRDKHQATRNRTAKREDNFLSRQGYPHHKIQSVSFRMPKAYAWPGSQGRSGQGGICGRSNICSAQAMALKPGVWTAWEKQAQTAWRKMSSAQMKVEVYRACAIWTVYVR